MSTEEMRRWAIEQAVALPCPQIQAPDEVIYRACRFMEFVRPELAADLTHQAQKDEAHSRVQWDDSPSLSAIAARMRRL